MKRAIGQFLGYAPDVPSFQVFDKRGSPVAKEATVTLLKGGPIALNRPAVEALGEPPAIELLFDPDEQIIGIRGVAADVRHAYPLRNTASNTGQYLISGVAFTKFYDIKTDISRRYLGYMSGNVLCVDLTGPSSEIIVRRRNERDKSPRETRHGHLKDVRGY
jgi:hypothetical protein